MEKSENRTKTMQLSAVLSLHQEVAKTPSTGKVRVSFMSRGKGRRSSYYNIQS